jgi:hypothetical protein
MKASGCRYLTPKAQHAKHLVDPGRKFFLAAQTYCVGYTLVKYRSETCADTEAACSFFGRSANRPIMMIISVAGDAVICASQFRKPLP